MATIAPGPQLQHPAESDEGEITRFIDRWIYVLMAAFLVLKLLLTFMDLETLVSPVVSSLASLALLPSRISVSPSLLPRQHSS